MKYFLLSILVVSQLSFSQDLDKIELKKIIRKSVKTTHSSIKSYNDLFLAADNTDSLFFSSKKVILYTYKKSEFCRWVELKFWTKDFVSFSDCQVCEEPSNCYTTNTKNSFDFKIVTKQKKILLVFENSHEKRVYQVSHVIRDENNEILEIGLIRI